MDYTIITNHQTIPIQNIPLIGYEAFFELNTGLVTQYPARHCVMYFGFREHETIRLTCCIADDLTHEIYISSCRVNPTAPLNSFAQKLLCFEKFEREIHENFGIKYIDHPWLKPVRYPSYRANKSDTIANYPFFSIHSDELHKVAVGPIHAGVIEPGHFRFICNGEQILHLEIQLGYQHRGVEQLFVDKKKMLERATLAESIAGDTAVGHTTAFSYLWESLCGYEAARDIHFSRIVALELERIAIHTGDLSAICTDIAYQLGSAVYGRLRTPVINFMQEWCGNRLAKGLIRPGRNQFPFTRDLANRLIAVFDAFEPDFDEISEQVFKLPSVLSRLERTGVLTYDQILEIGTVGIPARMGGLSRDVRLSHPYGYYTSLPGEPLMKHHGDVYSRVQLRKLEVKQSIAVIRTLLPQLPEEISPDALLDKPKPNSFCLSLIEGWRGEICHVGITDKNGAFMQYKVKDPSFHNWLALALAVRNNEISDFPVCNKSFNLSYCGHDL